MMALVPLHETRSELLGSLEGVFNLLRTQFVHDFVFTSDLVADISILTAPVQIEHGVAARITICGVETESRFAHVFDYSTDFYFAAIPAFSVGGVTVGFCTKQTARDPSHAMLHEPPMEASRRVECHRYVRDDNKGLFVLLSEDNDKKIIEIDCMSHQSSRKRTRVCARFNNEILKANLRSEHGPLSIDNLTHGLTYLNVCEEIRPCPVCQLANETVCDCVLPFKRPIHPLDFRSEKVNMGLHTGRYQGTSKLKLYKDGNPFIFTNLNTRSIIKGSLDKLLISRLNKYAVEDRMSRLNVNPFALMMPKTNAICQVDKYNETVDPIAELLGQDTSKTRYMENCDITLPETTILDRSAIMDTSTETALENVLIPVSQSGFNASAFLSAMTVFPPNSVLSDKSSVNLINKDINKNGEMCERTTEEEEEEEKMVLTEKERKLEQRKQRNREAAAKSNIKRKERNEALRRDLKEVHQKALELRGIEKRLREENVRLRGLATKKKIRVSSHLTHIQIAP